ncbi:MAG: hypothetical protein ABSC93_29570 [Bryobacteraceae bacterium]
MPWRKVLGLGQTAALGPPAAGTAAAAAVVIAIPIVVAAGKLLGSYQWGMRGWNRACGGRNWGDGRFGRRLGRGQRDRGSLSYHRGQRRRGAQGSRSLFHLQDLLFDAGYDLVVFVVVLEEIRHVEEGIAIQADIHKGGLHPRQDARHAALMNAPGQRIFFLALIINFDYLIFFEDRDPGFMAIRGNN